MNSINIKDEKVYHMDFRMDKISWVMIIFILITFMYFIVSGATVGIGFAGYLQAFGLALLLTIALIAISCIPVLIACYFIKKIPDIDYSIWVATGLTVIGLISELIV